MAATCQFLHATGNRPGAIGIIQLHGECQGILSQLTGVNDWPVHRARLVRFADIDEGIAVRITPHVTQIMPHGGPRVMQRLTAKLFELGAHANATIHEPGVDPLQIFPEAADRIEAITLLALALAESPLAIELLLDQPARWRKFLAAGDALSSEDRERSERLNRLIDPPIVVLAGRPNVGKSTLSNALLGREMSITLDMPGTTRDYTAGRIDLAGLVVDWHDTPGIRRANDPIEAKAIDNARRLIARADLLIAMAEPAEDQGTPAWPDVPRPADLQVVNKVDRSPNTEAQPEVLRISAHTGQGLAEFVAAVRERLVPTTDLHHPGPWLFDRRLVEQS